MQENLPKLVGLTRIPKEYKRAYDRWQKLTEKVYGQTCRASDKPKLKLDGHLGNALNFCRWYYLNPYQTKVDINGRKFQMVVGDLIGKGVVVTKDNLFFVPVSVRRWLESKKRCPETKRDLIKSYGKDLHPEVLAYMMFN